MTYFFIAGLMALCLLVVAVLFFSFYPLQQLKARLTANSRAQEAERLLNELIHTNLLPCLILDSGGRIVAYNDEAVNAFGAPEGLSPSEFHDYIKSIQPDMLPGGADASDILQDITGIPNMLPIGAGTSEVWSEVISESLEKGFSQATIQLERPDAAQLYFMINVARIAWMDDYRLVIYFYDMSAQASREAEAREAEERIKLMLDSTPMMCIMRDNKNRIIDCNQEAMNILGISDKAIFCRDFYTLFPEYQPDGSNSMQRVDEILAELDDTGYIMLERTFQTPTGELIPVESKIVRIPWKDNHRYISYSRDLRETKANEQKMAEIMNKEREAQIQREAAQAADEAKDKFLANMSHEIRTPMNAVLGMSELLFHEELNERQMRYVRDINTSANALLDIINDILDVSKIQAGKINLSPVNYSFRALLDNISSIAHSLIESKKIVFRMNIDDDMPACLYGDEARLRQVLLNLLSNAIKFTNNGDVTLNAGLDDDNIIISIVDTGIGIPDESIATLFDPFVQVALHIRGKTQGTGLGLTITKSIVELMNGSIEVKSVLGEGAEFTIKIPKIAGDPALIGGAGVVSDSMVFAQGVKALIVEDNEINMNVAIGLLSLCGINADAAYSGREALEFISKNEYDIVFMDHWMPEMTGIETTKLVREMGKRMPIIALTANTYAGFKDTMLDAGMDDYLSKPVIKSDLVHILKTWLPAEMQPDAGTQADGRPDASPLEEGRPDALPSAPEPASETEPAACSVEAGEAADAVAACSLAGVVLDDAAYTAADAALPDAASIAAADAVSHDAVPPDAISPDTASAAADAGAVSHDAVPPDATGSGATAATTDGAADDICCAADGAADNAGDEAGSRFWDKIAQIDEISLAAGLDIVGDERGVYKKSMLLLTSEIETDILKLDEYLDVGDLQNFQILVHGMKSMFAGIGANGMAERAFELENASGERDALLCAAKLPEFTALLDNIHHKLAEAFSSERRHDDDSEALKEALGDAHAKAPEEVFETLHRLADAIKQLDLLSIDNELTNLDSAKFGGAVQNEVEQIKDSVLLMEYDRANELISAFLAAV